MSKPSDEQPDRTELRAKIMGLGEQSSRKSYYPQLQARIKELEEKSATLLNMMEDLDGALRKTEESERRFRLLFEHIADGILVTDIETERFIMENESACRMLGYTRDELSGLSLADIHPAADFPWIRDKFQSHARGETEAPSEIPVKRQDGGIFWAEIRSMHFDLDGRSCLMGVLRDITERRRAKDALQQAHNTLERRVEERTAELAASNRQLGQEIEERKKVEEALRESQKQLKHLSSQLVRDQERERKRIANEIHDSIGQPLHAIKIGLKDLLHQDDALPKEVKSLKNLLSMIDFAIEEVRNIYTDLRPSLLDDLGILAVINWFLREFKKTYPDIRIEEQISIQEEKVPEPIKTVIFRVLQSALDNIARHSRAKSVHISLQGEGDGIRFIIQDNGMGFNLEDVPFGAENHVGLGLATMQERVESSGGIFTIKSVKEAGTIVRALWQTDSV